MYHISDQNETIHKCESLGYVYRFVYNHLYKKVFYPIRFNELDAVMENFYKKLSDIKKTVKLHKNVYTFRYAEYNKEIVLYISYREKDDE